MVVGVIPARLNSTRFPRKILAPIKEKPMVIHVYERAKAAKNLEKVIIAIDHEEVAEVLEPFGAEVVMTAEEHQSGSDRVAEVVRNVAAKIVVNIQADEPFLDPQIIDDMVGIFQEKDVKMATAVSTEITAEDLINPHTVKVLLDEKQNAILFRREVSQPQMGGCYRHIGIYAFRKEFLLEFTTMPPSGNEIKYNLEQLRALDNGIPIRTIITDYRYRGIDTEEDLLKLCVTSL